MGKISRRTFLSGLGATCYLPQLEIMGESKAVSTPKRLCAVFFPFGVSISHKANKNFNEEKRPNFWFPHTTGKNYEVTKALEPLIHKNDFSVLSGLSHPQCRHFAHITNHFLTGSSLARGVNNHISIDQVIAGKLGEQTRLNSLVLSTENNGISIDPKGAAIPALKTPRSAFEYLFGGTKNPQEIAKRQYFDKKIVDTLLEDYHRLKKKLGSADSEKLEEYLTTINEVETKIKKAERWAGIPLPKINRTVSDYPLTKLEAKDYFDLMYDIIYLSFETDQTRVATLMYGADNASKSALNKIAGSVVKCNLHQAGHKYKYDALLKWDIFLSERLNTFIEKLKKSNSVNGSLLDNTIILHGSSTSSLHNYRNYPVLLAGGKNIGYKHGGIRKIYLSITYC